MFQFREMPPTRIVFDVSLEGSARKVISVRSALVIDNKLDDDVQLRLDNSAIHTQGKSINIFSTYSGIRKFCVAELQNLNFLSPIFYYGAAEF